MAARTRTASPAGGIIAAILLGGAVATVIGTIMTYADLYWSLVQGRQHYTAYYALQCLIVGFFTAVGLMLTRPRGPLAPIVAAIAAYIALYVGIRAGVLIFLATEGDIPGEDTLKVLKPSFEIWDVLTLLVAGAIGGLRVLMVASSHAGRRPPNQPFGQPPGQPFGQPPGQPFSQPGAYGQPMQPAPAHPTPGHPMPGHPMPGQPMPGQPMPGQGYQPPPPVPGPGPGQGQAPGGPQGWGPPYGGV
ncbi:MAG: hypothetical protein ACRDNL_25380 [Spirillospora sp.]